MRKRLLIALVLFATLVGGLAIFAPPRLEAWVYAKHPAGNWTPEGLDFKDVTIRAEDGVIIHGWYVPHDKPRAAMIYAHGSVGNVTARADTLRKLHEHGVAVMIFDYRGYGKSEGVPSEAGFYLDGKTSRTWLSQTLNLPENQIVLFGHSLGSYVALQMAVDRGAKGLILHGGDTSLSDFLAENWWFPKSRAVGYAFDNLSRIENYKGPLLMRHGRSDRLTPLAHAETLFAKANEPKRLLVDDGGHDDFTAEFWAAFDQFIDQLNQPPAAP